MAEEFNAENLTPEELAKHLRKPDGETGKIIGLEMNKGNKHICLNSYKVLSPANGQYILEIGMGNGFFVKDLLSMADSLMYTGVDFSSTMVQEARQVNEGLIKSGVVGFKEASIDELPFPDNFFDCITTTNTLYFWPNPEENTDELLRVLKPKGKLLIAYRSKEFLDQLALAEHGFTKYESESVENLLENAGFNKVSTAEITEPELEFDGKKLSMTGFYTMGFKG
ncbi:MAG: class I SAM-dependent methyltransferase [Bacteroidota bacterium]